MASSSRATSKRRGESWSWWDEVNWEQGVGGGSRPWACKICPYTRTGGADKVRAHFFHESGKQVQFCRNITPQKRRELLEKVAGMSASQSARRRVVDPATMCNVEPPSQSRPAPPIPDSSAITPPQHQRPRGRQSTIDATWDPNFREEVDAAVARFFFHDHIAFNVARSPYFKAMIEKITEYARGGRPYTPPSSEAIRTTLLEREKQVVEQATSNVKQQFSKNGVSLITDGWSDTQRRSIHGMVAYSRGEMYYVDCHDASATGKTADALAGEWITAMMVIGPENVVGVVVDGEPSNRAAARVVENAFPHVTVSYCMAHCLNNLLKDIGNLSWIAPVISKACDMVTFVLNHQFLRVEFRKYSRKVLLKYSETRFAYNFLMLGRVRECSGALRHLFISDEFTSSNLATTTTGNTCMEMAESSTFWEEVKSIDAMVQPILHLLRIVDAMQPCIGKVYEAMDRMIEKLHEHVANEDQYDEIRQVCVARWNAYASPLHAAAFVVDPEFQGCGQERDKEVGDMWRLLLNKLVPDADTRRKIRDQLSAYRQARGSFGCVDAQNDRTRIGAALWWEDYGSDGPELQQLAIRILSQAVSTSCLEQLWSTFAHVASKKRNRLGVEKTNDLIFVSANLRMLCKSIDKRADRFRDWEEQQEREGEEEEEEMMQQQRETRNIEPHSDDEIVDS